MKVCCGYFYINDSMLCYYLIYNYLCILINVFVLMPMVVTNVIYVNLFCGCEINVYFCKINSLVLHM